MTTTPDTPSKLSVGDVLGRVKKWWKLGAIALVVLMALTIFGRGGERSAGAASFPVRKGPLRITVLENGEVQALESQTIASQVRGQTKIIGIVEEGYRVTPEDVENGLILVELDSADLEDRIVRKEIEYQSALARLTEAQEQYQIQLKQNESDVKAAELQVKFKRMDLEKYLGADLALDLLDELGIMEVTAAEIEAADLAVLEELEEVAEQNPAPDDSDNDAETEDILDMQVELILAAEAQELRNNLDFRALAQDRRLAGEAVQRRQRFETDILLAEEDLSTAKDTYEWTIKLAEEEFVTETQRRQDEMAVTRSEISLASSKLAQELFLKYEFPKEAERLLSDYEEALRGLSRTVKRARSQLAQSSAQLRSAEARYSLELQQRNELKDQLEKCIIVAERPGLVVYGDSGGGRGMGGREPIMEGSSVHERQQIITIPDMTKMSVKVSIHESSIQKVSRGQRATIKVEAFPERELIGEVSRVGILPEMQSRWLNPDLKVYETIVVVDGTHDWLRPGMTAQVEIIIDELDDVLYIPIQAVSTVRGERVTYLARLGRDPERRVIQTGQFNDTFIQVTDGLNEGDEVLLVRPDTGPDDDRRREDIQAPPAETVQAAVAG